MNRIFYCILLLSVFLGCGKEEYTYIPKVQKPVSDSLLLAQRKQLFHEYLKSADSIANVTKNIQAIYIIHFLRQFGKIAVPSETGYRLLETSTSDTSVAIVLLAPGEESISKDWYIFSKMNAVAAYQNSMKMLVIRPTWNVSPLCRSLTLIHEGYHVVESFNKDIHNYKKPTALEICQEEKDVYTLMNELQLKLGGNAYKDLLNRSVEAYFQELKRQGKKVDYHFIPDRSPNGFLDGIFGPFQSIEEISIWQLSFQIQMFYLLVDRYGSGNKEMIKTRFWQEVYIKMGIIKENDKFN